MFTVSVSKTKLPYFRMILRPNPDVNLQNCSRNFVGRYIRKIIASLEDPIRKVSSIKKDDYSTPHPPKDPPDPYVPDNIVHEAFDPPRKIPKTVFRKFKSPNEVLGPNADKCKEYKNPEYYSYHRYSFVNLQRASLKLRKERIQDQQEAESDAEFDAQLEAEWEAMCEKEQELKCPNEPLTEVKCVENTKVEETFEDLHAQECQKQEEEKVSETIKKEEKQEDNEECRKQSEEECRKARQKQREEEACREVEEQKIEEEKKKKREEMKHIEEECKKKAEENLKALAARKNASEKKATDVKPKAAEATKDEKTKQELELRKMIEKCKRDIIHKRRIEEKCKRATEQRMREEKCRQEMERVREEIDAKNLAEKLREEEEEKCMKSDSVKTNEEENEQEVFCENKEKAETCQAKDAKQCLETAPPGVRYFPGAAVCDTKSEEEKSVSNDGKNQKDDK